MLNDFKQVYIDRYQDVFNKVLVGMKIASTRLQAGLKYGESVTRTKYDLSSVIVRDVTNLVDRTVDTITDSEELLAVDQKKGTTFAVSSHEMTQAGPLNPAFEIGKQAAIKTATYIDADILYEATNAFAAFDNGNLTTGAPTGTAITVSTTTVPQMIAQAPARLRVNNQSLSNLAWVVDSYALSQISQYILSKNIDMAGSEFRNGFAGKVANAEMYVSENLTGEAVLSIATNLTADDTVSIGGVTWTCKAAPSVAGEFDLGANVDATRVILANAINGSATGAESGTGYYDVSAADRAILTALRITATDSPSGDTITVVGKGSGRLTVAETLTDGTDTWTKNFVHAYFGKKGAIDVVIQDKVDIEVRPEPKQRSDNILSDVLYGIKTFNDGSQGFLDVHINA